MCFEKFSCQQLFPSSIGFSMPGNTMKLKINCVTVCNYPVFSSIQISWNCVKSNDLFLNGSLHTCSGWHFLRTCIEKRSLKATFLMVFFHIVKKAEIVVLIENFIIVGTKIFIIPRWNENTNGNSDHTQGSVVLLLKLPHPKPLFSLESSPEIANSEKTTKKVSVALFVMFFFTEENICRNSCGKR